MMKTYSCALKDIAIFTQSEQTRQEKFTKTVLEFIGGSMTRKV